ncbi:dTDP-4-dehydrorhamnose reductase [Arenibacter sp. M-2]|uniref:dTDP-4-dehydrorhamnose reductase n=1 Tax=Arenibacter sp. M-2 TaxID=3053612 RepID=UPI002570B375|nr:dTDP-4-dehydrorhamnose reductase [Arenibacter sp. M-2]MDL5510249.1 dTDP-4-dehydrorhamnose reductase [Arenibacter sp. M-2]
MEEVIPKKLKLLITGANGQLGRCLQDVSKTLPSYDFHFKTSKELDVTNQEQINILFAEEEFDYCINCAAYTAVDKAETDRENAFLVNAEAVKYLAEACKTQNSILIHISTDFVFDGSKTTPYVEEDIPNPINIYGLSKLKGEQYVQQIVNKHFIIRTSWVYSQYGHNFVKTMLRLGSEREQINVVNDQKGSPTYGGDLANAIMSIINSNSTNYGLYHYSHDGAISWWDFASEIFKVSNISIKLLPLKTEEYPAPAKRPSCSVLDKSKIKDTFKIEIPNWKNSLRNCIKTIETN